MMLTINVINRCIRLFGFGALILLLTGLQNCGDKTTDCIDPRNPECENYNPCIDAKETSARFIIQEVVYPLTNDELMPRGHFISYETDTVRQFSETIFTCPQKSDSIWWIFNDTDIRPSWQQKQSFTIRFGNTGNPEKTPQRVKITCVVKNNKPNTCFPNDNGLDTFTRYLVYMPVYQTGFIGTYRGSLTSNPDSIFTLNLRFDSLIRIGDIPAITLRFNELLTEPAYESSKLPSGLEYGYNGSDFGYNCAYLAFTSVSGEPGISTNYKGKTIIGIAMRNGSNNTIKIDFIRHGTGIYRLNEWPPQNIPLLTFTGNKIK